MSPAAGRLVTAVDSRVARLIAHLRGRSLCPQGKEWEICHYGFEVAGVFTLRHRLGPTSVENDASSFSAKLE